MRRLNVRPNERRDKIHDEVLMDGVEQLARDVIRMIVPRSSAGAGVVSGSCTYDSGLGAFQITDLVAIDASGNPCIKLGSWYSAIIPAQYIGVTPLYIWAAVQPGTTPSSPARRVRRLAGAAEESFHGETVRVDAIQAMPSDTAPPDLVAPAASWFKIFEITAWDGGTPNLPTIKPVAPLGLGLGIAPGSVLGALNNICLIIAALKGTAGWDDAPADTIAGLDSRVTSNNAAVVALTNAVNSLVAGLQASVDALDGRVDDLESEESILTVPVPLITAGMTVQTNANGEVVMNSPADAQHNITIPVNLPASRPLKYVGILGKLTVGTAATFTLYQREPVTGTVTSMGAVTWDAVGGFLAKPITLDPPGNTGMVYYLRCTSQTPEWEFYIRCIEVIA